MRRPLWVVMFAGVAFCLGAARASGKEDKEEKGKVFEMDSLKSPLPSSWKQEKPKIRLRHAQFRLPRAEDDPADGDLAIFKGISGSTEQNIALWKGRFRAPEGKKLDDVSKLTRFKVAGCEVVYFDIAGTYLDTSPQGKTTRRPEYRMLAVQFEGKDNVWHIKLLGPERTVEKHKKDFDGWLKAFK